MVQPLRGVGITQANGIVEVEEQGTDGTAQLRKLPPWQEGPLQQDVGSAQVMEEPQARPPALREWPRLQRVPCPLECRPESGQSVATTNMRGTFHQCRQSHSSPR